MSSIMDSTDLIYNRFDVIHAREKERLFSYYFSQGDKEYELDLFVRGRIADINIWGKEIPDVIFQELKKQVEAQMPDICAFYIQRGTQNYDGMLMKGNEAILRLPSSEKELLNKLTKKEQYNIRRAKKFGNVGDVCVKTYKGEDIPDKLVERFFQWKLISHGKDYRLEPDEYLLKYHVTDAMEMSLIVSRDKRDDCDKCLDNSIDVIPVAVLFWNENEGTAYFENFSYDKKYSKYSPGYLIYIEFLKELINRHCVIAFLGGGAYEYKRKFGAVVRDCYTGFYCTQTGIEKINCYMSSQNVRNWGIYGGGNLGRAVLNLSKKFEKKLSFVIDKNPNCIDDFPVYTPDEEWPQTDLIIVAISEKRYETDELLKNRYCRFIYFDDWIQELFSE